MHLRFGGFISRGLIVGGAYYRNFTVRSFPRQGECKKTSQDLVERFWDFLTTLDSNIVAQFMKDNLAGTVVVFSLLIWIPVSCYVNRLVSGKTFSNCCSIKAFSVFPLNVN